MDDSLCRWLASVNIHELDVELLLSAFSSERISTLDDLVDVVGDAELQQIVLDVLQAQPISRVAAKRIERALKALSLTSVLPAAANGSSAPSTPPRVPFLCDEETPQPPPLPDRPASRATRHLAFEPPAPASLSSPSVAAVHIQAAARRRAARLALQAARVEACRQCYEVPVWFWDRGVPTEAAAHAALCPQSEDYDNFLAFRHALAAWYFAHPGDVDPDFPPRPPPNPVLLKASPDHQAAPLNAERAGPTMTAVTVESSNSLQSSTEPGSGSSIGPVSPAASSTAAAARSASSRSHRHRLHHRDALAVIPWGWRIRRALDLRFRAVDAHAIDSGAFPGDFYEIDSIRAACGLTVRDLEFITEQLGTVTLGAACADTKYSDGGCLAGDESASDPYAEVMAKIDLTTPDHVFVERALADFRIASRLVKDDDADWQPAALDDGHSDYDLPGCDAVEDGGTGCAAADVWDVGDDDDDCAGDEGGCE